MQALEGGGAGENGASVGMERTASRTELRVRTEVCFAFLLVSAYDVNDCHTKQNLSANIYIIPASQKKESGEGGGRRGERERRTGAKTQ